MDFIGHKIKIVLSKYPIPTSNKIDTGLPPQKTHFEESQIWFVSNSQNLFEL